MHPKFICINTNNLYHYTAILQLIALIKFM